MDAPDDDNGGHLSPGQMEKLVQLQDLTGIDDLEICRALLESKNWDLEATAREQLGIPSEEQEHHHPGQRGVPEMVEEESEEEPSNPPPLQRQPPGHVHRNAVWRRPQGAIAWALYLLTLPIKVVYSSVGGVWDFVTSLLGFPPRRSSAVVDPLGDVNNFYMDFERQYGTTHPRFYRGTYSQVLEEAKRELKFLLVYLHSEAHQDTDIFCRGTLAHTDVVQYVTENMLFWGCSIRRQEGHRVSQALRENGYPFLAVIVLRQNRMVVVGRIEGHIEAAPLVARLENIVRDYEAFIVAARVERDERNFNREIRSEQDQAFLETLRQDQEREQRKKNEEEDRAREEEEKRKLEEEEDRKRREKEDEKERVARLKIDMASEVPEEPAVGDENGVRLMIKLPGGQRLERRFLKTHSLKCIYYFVFCHPDSPDDFDIVTNYPRRVLSCKPTPDAPDPPTLQESGLGPTEVLFVNDLDA